MKGISRWSLTLALMAVMGLCAATFSEAANIAVLSNQYAPELATDFNAQLTGHTFTGIDVSTTTPTLAELQAYDAVLLFEDGTFSNATNVGNVVAQYANSGHAVILGTFYDQDRSDAGGHGWGALESIDPNTTDTVGCSYTANAINAASIVAHPLTTGVTSLFSGPTGYSGGNQAKPGSVVLANWTNLNELGNPDPAIAYRITGNACVIHIGIIPHYGLLGTYGVDFGGDFYQVWQNASDYAVGGCQAVVAAPVPAMTDWGMMTFVLLAGSASVFMLRRKTRRA